MTKLITYPVIAIAACVAVGSVSLGVDAGNFVASVYGTTAGIVVTDLPKLVPAFKSGQGAAGGGTPAAPNKTPAGPNSPATTPAAK